MVPIRHVGIIQHITLRSLERGGWRTTNIYTSWSGLINLLAKRHNHNFIFIYVHNTVLSEEVLVGNFVFVVREAQLWALSTVQNGTVDGMLAGKL